MKPAWDQLMSEYQGSESVLVADIDCTRAGELLCKEQNIKGYPTIKYGNPEALTEYKGGRDVAALRKFTEEKLSLLVDAELDLGGNPEQEQNQGGNPEQQQNQTTSGNDEGKSHYLPKQISDVQVLTDLGDGRFKVLPKVGVAFRLSKDLQDRSPSEGVDHNQIFSGIDEGEWVKVERIEPAVYLPKTANGVQVLTALGNSRFKVLPEHGVAFRLSKSLQDRDGDRGVDQGQIISGIEEGTWVKFERVEGETPVFLPKAVNGVQALTDLGNSRFKVLPEHGMAFRLTKNLEDRDGDLGVDGNETIHGIDEGEWVKVERLGVGEAILSINEYLQREYLKRQKHQRQEL